MSVGTVRCLIAILANEGNGKGEDGNDPSGAGMERHIATLNGLVMVFDLGLRGCAKEQ